MGRSRECEGKVQYRTRAAARDQCFFLRRTTMTLRLHEYRCDYCGFWHVGHRPRRRHN